MDINRILPDDCAQLIPVSIEAIGDDFAQVSGVWLTGPRVASFLSWADKAWVFAARDAAAAQGMVEALAEETGMRVSAIVPGMRPGWPKEDAHSLRTLMPDADMPLVGLCVALETPTEGCSYGDCKCATCENTCSARHATNGNP